MVASFFFFRVYAPLVHKNTTKETDQWSSRSVNNKAYSISFSFILPSNRAFIYRKLFTTISHPLFHLLVLFNMLETF